MCSPDLECREWSQLTREQSLRENSRLSYLNNKSHTVWLLGNTPNLTVWRNAWCKPSSRDWGGVYWMAAGVRNGTICSPMWQWATGWVRRPGVAPTFCFEDCQLLFGASIVVRFVTRGLKTRSAVLWVMLVVLKCPHTQLPLLSLDTHNTNHTCCMLHNTFMYYKTVKMYINPIQIYSKLK